LLRSWLVGGVLAGVMLAGLPATASAAPSLKVSPPSVEVGDAITFTVKGARGRCSVKAPGKLGGRVRNGKLTKTVTARAKPGTHTARLTCGRQKTTARFVVHGMNGPDFELTLTAGAHDKKARTRFYRVQARNLAPWTATSARVCVRVSGTRLLAVTDRGRLRTKTSACSATVQIAAGRIRGFSVKAKAGGRVRATVAVAAANSMGATRTFTAKGAKIKPGKARAAQARPRARAAQAPAVTGCTTTGQVGVAFVADDSGSMADNDPLDLRGDAIAVALDQLPDGSVAAGTRFAEYSVSLFSAREVTAATRPSLKRAARNLRSSGNTDYEEAFDGARRQLERMTTPRKAVVFLSDGQPSYSGWSSDGTIAAAGIPIFTIGFGDADESVLAGIAARSGGQSFFASSAEDLQSIFARVIASITCASAAIHQTLALAPGETQTIPYAVGWDDGEFRALAAWSGGHLTVTAVRPDGSVLAPNALRTGETFSDNPTYALLTGVDPPVGQWALNIASDVGNADTVNVSIDVFKKGLPPLPQPAPLVRKTDGRNYDVCADVFPGVKSTTKKVRFGEETTYSRANSLFLVCTGFGSDVPTIEMTLGQKCAFVSAVGALAGGALADPSLRAFETLCSGTDTLVELASGNFAGVAGQHACNTFGSLFSTAAGLIVAGATASTGAGAVFFGTATYRAFAAGFKLACGGVFSLSTQWGRQLEAKHEANVARDIATKGKCLRLTTRKALIDLTSWSAADCVGGGTGSW
jgi:hypothetical protein